MIIFHLTHTLLLLLRNIYYYYTVRLEASWGRASSYRYSLRTNRAIQTAALLGGVFASFVEVHGFPQYVFDVTIIRQVVEFLLDRVRELDRCHSRLNNALTNKATVIRNRVNSLEPRRTQVFREQTSGFRQFP